MNRWRDANLVKITCDKPGNLLRPLEDLIVPLPKRRPSLWEWSPHAFVCLKKKGVKKNDISGLSVLGGHGMKLPAPGQANSSEIIGFKRRLGKWRRGLGESS